MTTREPPCQRCECRAESHARSEEDEERGACAECTCEAYCGPREVDYDEPEHEIVDGPCEYERLGARQ